MTDARLLHALALKPNYPQALYNRAIALQHVRRQDDVAASFARLLELAPDFPFAPGMLVHARMHCCDWSQFERAFSEIVGIARLSDREAAAAIRDRKIDLLVNLNGYFGRETQRVFSFRPCPVQVSYLGFPGTLGAPYIDYVLADHRVIPEGHDALYTEKVVRLPDTYQVNDRKRVIAERMPASTELGLPAMGFVFRCFNNNYNITPRTFDRWMRLLDGVPGSVLWLLEGNAAAGRNLRQEAQRRGVAPDRLVFAPRL